MPIFIGLYFALGESIFFRLGKFLWIDNLAAPDMLIYWGEGIPLISDPDNQGGLLGFLYLGPYFNLLPIIAVALMIVQQIVMTPPPQDEQQAMQFKMMRYMMIVIGIMFYKIAGGLCMYIIISTLWGLAERKLLPKKKPLVDQASDSREQQRLGAQGPSGRKPTAEAAGQEKRGHEEGRRLVAGCFEPSAEKVIWRAEPRKRPVGGPNRCIIILLGVEGPHYEPQATDKPIQIRHPLGRTRLSLRFPRSLACLAPGRKIMARFLAVSCAILLAALPALLLTTSPILGQADSTADIPYEIKFDPGNDVSMHTRHDGKEGLFITVKFTVILRSKGQRIDSSDYKIAIEEDGQLVKEIDVPVPKPVEDLSVVMAVDTSGSMVGKRMEQVRLASDTFLKKLPGPGRLRPHPVRSRNPRPGLSPRPSIAPRSARRSRPCIRAAAPLTLTPRPRGSTCSRASSATRPWCSSPTALTSTARRRFPRSSPWPATRTTRCASSPSASASRASSNRSTASWCWTTSGSMLAPADNSDPVPKIKALHRAAVRFVDMIPSTARTTLLPFSSGVDSAKPFSNVKYRLKSEIEALKAEGETALFDAVFEALCTLEAENPRGKRVVVAMTDGIDNTSRRRVEEVIQRAKEAKIPLYLLGFGRDGELDSKTMRHMAEESGGQFYHARNEKDLMDIFENLSIQLHDDGIDEETLRTLASLRRGASTSPAKNVAELKVILERVTEDIQKQFHEITFPSRRQVNDGLQRRISLKLVHRGQAVTNVEGGAQTHGVVIAEMNHLVYLVMLGILGLFLAALPAWLKRTT